MDFYLTGDKVLLHLVTTFLAGISGGGRIVGFTTAKTKKYNCYFISTTAKFYVGIVQTNGKTANAMSQLQMKCYNCNSNGTLAKTKLPKLCHVFSKAETHQISYSGAIIICPIYRSASFSVALLEFPICYRWKKLGPVPIYISYVNHAQNTAHAVKTR
jgi:hypothetical protein